MLQITPLTLADIPAALRLSTQAGWNQVEQDWQRLLELWPDGCLAGRLHNQLVATATVANYGVIAWVGMILVDEAQRGRGIGQQMLRVIVDLADQRNIPALGLDATDLGRPLYLKLGFEDRCPIQRWARKLEGEAPADPRRANPGSAGASPSISDMLVLDRQILGVDRSTLLADLQNTGSVFVTQALDAFAMVRPGRTAFHIGPIVAQTESAAQKVLADVFAAHPHHSFLIDLPAPSPLANFLTHHGFAPARHLTRMTRPKSAPTLCPTGIFAAAGFELG